MEGKDSGFFFFLLNADRSCGRCQVFRESLFLLNSDRSCEYLQKARFSGLIKPIFVHDYFGFSGGL